MVTIATYHIAVKKLPDYTEKLRVNDKVYLSGTVYTARDAAQKRFCALLDQGKPLPFELKGAAIYLSLIHISPELPGGCCQK